MQTLMDVCPLRIDCIMVRTGPEPALCVNLLGHDQPVSMTEAQVVRIRKRSRGLLGSLFSSLGQ